MLKRASFILLCVFGGLSCAHEPQSKYELRGFWHRVDAADSARSLAARYGADANAIAELNDLKRGQTIVERQEVFIPKRGGREPGRPVSGPSAGRGPKAIAAKQESEDVGGPRSLPGASPREAKLNREAQAARPKCAQTGFGCLKWPVKGKLVSLFGKKGTTHHDGIDILAEKGTPILAARGGEVLYSGADIKGYGNLIILRHSDGVLSIYAHNDTNLVSEGERVEEGQAVARVGQTGSTSRPCLHFEVRMGEDPRDPLLYLP